MKKLLAAFLFTVTVQPVQGQEMVLAASEMARTLALEMKERGKTRVAVATFRDHLGAVTLVGAFFSEEVTSQLLVFKGNNLSVVERSRTDAVLAEQKLGLDGLRESGKLDAFVKILQVDALVVGTITTLPELGNRMRVNARLIAVPSGEGLASASVFVPLTSPRTDQPDSPPTVKQDELLKQGIPGPGGRVAPLSSRSVAVCPAAGQAQQTVESDDFSFALRCCRATGDKVTCDFIITNQRDDRGLNIYGNSRVFDEFGNEYYVVEGKLGNTRRDWGTAGPSALSNHLVSDIPIKAELSFAKIATEAQLLTVLEIICLNSSVQFRNVPVTR